MLERLASELPSCETVSGALGTELPFAGLHIRRSGFDARPQVRRRHRRCVDELARVLRPGGVTVLEFANGRSLAGAFGYRGSPIRFVTLDEAESMLRDAGVNVTARIAGTRLPYPIWRAARGAARRVLPRLWTAPSARAWADAARRREPAASSSSGSVRDDSRSSASTASRPDALEVLTTPPRPRAAGVVGRASVARSVGAGGAIASCWRTRSAPQSRAPRAFVRSRSRSRGSGPGAFMPTATSRRGFATVCTPSSAGSGRTRTPARAERRTKSCAGSRSFHRPRARCSAAPTRSVSASCLPRSSRSRRRESPRSRPARLTRALGRLRRGGARRVQPADDGEPARTS